MTPTRPPIHDFTPFSMAKLLEIRAARESMWSGLPNLITPKKRPSSSSVLRESKASIQLSDSIAKNAQNVPPELQKMMLEMLKKR